MSYKKTIGILTSGGDSPGMNAAIWATVKAAAYDNIRVLGFSDGYKGVLEKNFKELTPRDVDDILEKGGTMLGTARCLEMMEEEGRAQAVKNIEELHMDGLLVIGGDGSYHGAQVLSERGVPAVGIPGTIDNDLAYTDYTIGFDTALNTVCNSITQIRDTMRSHDRVGIVEVMGRHCGDIALNAALATGADHVLVPEIEYDEPFDVTNVANKIERIYQSGQTYAIIILAEGVAWDMENRAYNFRKLLAEKTGLSVRETVLGYSQRGGTPTIYDRRLAINMAVHGVELLKNGIGNRVIGRHNSQIFDMPIDEALAMPSVFNQALYDTVNRLTVREP